ncbi:unnamed protein product [Euphydryas editha]|uniref:Myb/SANT-like DNA-binding domain-containing protein n=1 Tax=Euphydryas editha TaxID=104508 RepID=A0AAU9TXT8_EUPED|nr:unnamed protein product [Euphydryas editha]
MENLQKLNLLECDTNTVYELEVTPEIYARATMDMVFATNLLKRSVHEGIHNWTREQVLLLIATYKEHQLEFLDENASKAEVWTNIVKEMGAQLAKHGLPPIDEKKCKTKMDTLKRHYKNLKDNKKKSGNSKINWPYYDEMDELFGEQPWVQPLSTAGSNIQNKMDAEIKSPPSKRQKTLKDFCEQLSEHRKKREETREKHHQEKIAAMNRLTDVVAQLVKQTQKED